MLVGSPQESFCGSRFDSFSARSRLGRRAQLEGGFSLPELLVVVLIIGILAAIFVPSLLGQTGKAAGAQAKALARAAQSAAETIATDDDGRYENVSTLELNKVEPAVRIVASSSQAYLSSASGSKDEYSVTAKATSGDEFTVTRKPSGEMVRTCVSLLTKAGCSGGETGAW